MNIVIFGPPGAGKGTQSKFIAEKFNMYQLSTGDILRKEMSKNTEIGKKISSVINTGSLVSDQIVSDMIEKVISNNDYHNKIFDGYPEIYLSKNLKIYKKIKTKISIVLKLSVSLKLLKKNFRKKIKKKER